MKRFRWGDVVPYCGGDGPAREPDDPDRAGLHALAVHGIAPVDPTDVEAVHLRLAPAD